MFKPGTAGAGWTDTGGQVVQTNAGDKVGINTASPTSTGLEINHATQAEFIITENAGTNWAAWTVASNTVMTWGDSDSSRDFIFQTAATFPFTGSAEIIRFKSNRDIVTKGKIDLSAVTAGQPTFRILPTSDTPAVTWGSGSGNEVSAAPAGYIEILISATSTAYIPFWG